MRVALFVPCYVDQFYPQVAVATLELLEKVGVAVSYPEKQTCCGQPMANAGFEHLTTATNEHFIQNFSNVDYIVAPSGSCVLHIKHHLHGSEKNSAAVDSIKSKIFELTEFLTDIIQVKKLNARFPHRIGLHQSCHGQRGLMLAQMSERVAPPFSKAKSLLKMVDSLEIVSLSRKDECCGFGGTFCVTEESVSVKMGVDRIADHVSHGVEYITGSDMSCLMHLEGILRKNKSKTKVTHIAEILNASAI